ncbi:MAG: LysR substrate-binding domain-containing protein [Burkholderiaceae bacterium]|jgi:DNA-binding transcriptional LysR family regulator
MRNLDMDLLRTLVTIQRTNTFSGAAEALFKTQSAVTQQMQRLETLMGFALFKKDGRLRTLTPEGLKLADYGRRILALNDEAIRTLYSNDMEGSLRFGSPLDVADTILPPVLTHIARHAPRVHMEIQVDRSPFLMDALRAGEIDLTISTRDDPDMSSIVLRTSPVAWICSADYVVKPGTPLPLILADERSIFRRLALDALSETSLTWHINYLATTLVGIKAAVRAGLGITARSIEFLETDMRVLGEAEGLPPLPSVTYRLLIRKETINPLTLQVYTMLREQLGWMGSE